MRPSDVIPPGSDAFNRKLADLQRQIDELRAARSAEATTVNRGGFTVRNGGYLRSMIPNGVETFYTGPLTFDGVSYYGIVMRRADGTSMFYSFPINGDPNVIAWRWRDHFGNEVVASDALTGGLARPWIPMPTVDMLASAIPMTASATFIGIQSTGSVAKQQPFVRCRALLRSDAGGIGTARFAINGVAVGTTMPIASGDFGWTVSQTIDLPGDFYDDVRVELEIQRTNATGSVGGVMVVSQRQT